MFLGASYFRSLAAGTRYGLSARGLAVDTVGGQGEEFPYFTEFWIVKPASDARTLRMFALLDSPRVSGAYQFDVAPGDETIVEVRKRLYLRAPDRHARHRAAHGHVSVRREPAASSGLQARGARLRRPDGCDGRRRVALAAADQSEPTLTTSFSMRDPKGFGLMQRDRSFASYEDPEARYDLRPSAWVEPIGSWGAGRVELVQISHTERDERQHRRVLGAGPIAGARRAARLRVSPALARRAHRYAAARSVGHAVARGPRLSRARRRRAAVHRRLHRPVARGVTAERTHQSRRLGARERRDPRDERVLPRSHGRVAHDGSRQAARRDAARRAARVSSERRGRADGDVEQPRAAALTAFERSLHRPRSARPLERTTTFFGFLHAGRVTKRPPRSYFMAYRA